MMTQTILTRIVKSTLISLLISMICTEVKTQIPPSPVSKLVLPAETQSFPFIWRGDSMHGSWDAHAVLLIPVRLQNCPRQLYMQFDLGSNYSMFYGPAMRSIQMKYPGAVPAQQNALFTDYRFKVGSISVLANEIVVREFGSGDINWQDSSAIVIIGTIGTDFIDNRFLCIDYPNQQMITGNDIPTTLSSGMSFSNLMYAGGRILLPGMIRDKRQLLYFDTGSSAFELMTDKPISELLATPGAAAVGFKVNSWGKQLSAFTLPTTDSITIGGSTIPIYKTTYVDGVNESTVAQMMKMGISGLTGNKLFLQSVLLLDLKNKKFGLKKR